MDWGDEDLLIGLGWVRLGRKITGMGTWVTIVVFGVGVVNGKNWFVGTCDCGGHG